MTSRDERLAQFYPDLMATGGLVTAINERARHLGVPLGKVVPGRGSSGERSAALNSPTGYLAVTLSESKRRFIVRIWDRGVELAAGGSPELDDVVRVGFAWQSGRTLRGIKEEHAFLLFDELAEAHERGDAVAFRWRMLRDDPDARIAALAVAAASVPEVAGLFPYLSHHTLRLSRVTGYPYTGDAPYVAPYSTPGPSYQVFAGDPVRVVADTESAGEAIRAVADRLPPGYGPARAGTADDLEGGPGTP
ncbi:DUF6193 family natural product biosynthesis protein [Actinacidiphila acidipaludis]|uniref:Uncharacterized protein n=1 Tax=Actinacidiphila acidipaludis TaxID=2873382 RepID=A0ABS7QB58_9ACTN|nr:DUF6193 family natural product biosynthesis protein [Streptomyces acidipaludis]MBY8879934.1 hypothetical protein [Streptomyces acidipaludis]